MRKRGRIVNVIKGNDDFVRVVDVKTENGLVRQAITEIAPPPIKVEEEIP